MTKKIKIFNKKKQLYLINIILNLTNKKMRTTNVIRIFASGGERGIRTPGASQHDGFQDRCNRPLYHLSLQDDQLGFLKRLQRYEHFLFLPNFTATFFIFISKKAFQTFVTPSKHHETAEGTCYHKEKTQ